MSESLKELIISLIKFCFKERKEAIDMTTQANTKEITQNLLNTLCPKLNNLTREMLKSITHMPYLKDLPELLPIYNYIKYISLSLSGCIVGYKGLKLLFSNDESDKIESKQIFGRLSYSFILGSLSLQFIDLLISANNCVSDLIISKFDISMFTFPATTGMLLPIAIFLFQIFEILKILIGFWMRMAELVFAGVISPAMFTCWINSEWSGYLKSWSKRVSVLVFTQVVLVLILVIYSMMLKGWCLTGSINGACLSIATLLLLNKGPKILQGYADNSAYEDAKSTVTKIINSKIVKTITKRK